MADDRERAEAEILDLHVFFEGWIAGILPNDDETYRSLFLEHLDEGFTMIQPSGGVADRGELVTGMRGAHGANPGFRIAITDVAVQMRVGDALVVMYTEWQKGAMASKTANNGRRSTVVFRDEGDRLIWSHLHETWLPADELALGPFER